ncbi:MAG: polysaccharide biosynthesis C-terminal domain-containing protein [Lentisphaeraceae bacterium]|nr:polysaccharide biosynthesis C-terminal domain-containing protein [Lentisphaeraceae bacterium]
MQKVLAKFIYGFQNVDKEILKGSMRAVFVRVWSVIAVFAMNLVICRQAGAKDAGLFFLSFIILNVLCVVCRKGFDNLLIKSMARFKQARHFSSITKLYRHTLVSYLLLLLPFSIALYISADILATTLFNKTELADYLRVLSVGLLPMGITFLNSLSLQGLSRVSLSMVLQGTLTASLVTILTLVLGLKTGLEISWVFTISLLAVMLVSMFFWRREQSNQVSTETFHLDITLKPLNSLFVISILYIILDSCCVLFLGVWASAEDIALFTTAYKVSLLVCFMLTAVDNVLAPKFAALYAAGDDEKLKDLAQKSAFYVSLLALPQLVIICLFAGQIMSLFGQEFTRGAWLLRFLAFSQFINVLTGSVGFLLQMTGKERVLKKNLLYTVVFVILGCLAFIPLWGIWGGALVLSLAISLQNILCCMAVRKELGFSMIGYFKLPVLTVAERREHVL